MAKETTNDIIDEVVNNLREDREVLKGFYTTLMKASEEQLKDPLVRNVLVESVARLASELVRNNSQLVEVTKIKLKKEVLENPEGKGFSDADKESMFDDIDRGDPIQ